MEPNEAPEVDLNGEAGGTDTSLGYTENAPLTPIAPAATVTDDSADLDEGSLTVAFTSGGTADDQLQIANQGFGPGQFLVDEGTLYYEGSPVGSIAGGADGTPLVVTFFASMTAAIAQALVRSIGYVNFSDVPVPGDRIVGFTLTDGDGGTSSTSNATITVTPVDDPAVAVNDTVTTPEDAVATGSLFADNGSGSDSDPDGPPLTVSLVNGSDNVGSTIILASGAKLTVNEDGTYSYDPDGQLDTLTDSTSGAVNTSFTETFTYTLSNGNTATVTVIVQGVAGPGDWLMGDETDNVITGTPGPDLFLLQQGGNDTAYGLGGNDVLYFGAAFTRRDRVDGGEGRDVLILQGNYDLTFSETNFFGIEALSLQTGGNTRWGDTEDNYYSYWITTDDANVAAGQQLIVNAGSLRDGESFIFDGSAENDGTFLVFGGQCDDWLEGGDGNDLFVFEGDRWGWYDMVDGRAGRDAVIINGGDGVTCIEFGEYQLTRVESISVSNVYSSDPDALASYEFVLSNGNVAEGSTLIVNGSSLTDSRQTISVDGSDVVDGNLILFGGAGADILIGGAGNDILYGAGGFGDLTGGDGADIFQYRSTADSGPNNPDSILDFVPGGVDLIDLHLIDANELAEGDQAFTFIGSSAFSGTGAASAGELRVYQVEGGWYVEGDTNGDGAADLVISVSTPPDTELSFGAFVV